jgi:hypothetical protein
MITAETFSTNDIPSLFVPVAEAMDEAILVAFDGCHKIYVAMDEVEADWFRESDYQICEASPEFMLVMVANWYKQSCPLKFVNAVRHNAENPNAGYTDLIPQGAGEEDEDWDDEDDEDEDW